MIRYAKGMPRMEDQLGFLENVENVVDTEQDKTKAQEDDGTNEDTKHCSSKVGEPYNNRSNKILGSARKPNETLADCSACQQINMMLNERKDNEHKAPSGKKNDSRLSSLGIDEQALESSCMGEWIAIDLDFNVYEMKQAQDVMYLREKRKRRNRQTILSRCCFI